MDESIKLSSGYRFNPFEEELISLYLKPKVLGQKLPCNVVEERQLYGAHANPWHVFDPENHSWILSEVTPGKFEKVTYVFVNLIKIATVEREKKIGRDNYMKRAGCGTWYGKTSRTEIRDRFNGDVIGERRLLVFEIDEDSDQDLLKVGYWKMHEYSLRGVNENISNPRNTVLCKITYDSSRLPTMKVHPKVTDDHPVHSCSSSNRSKPQKKNTNVAGVSSPSIMNNSSVEKNILVTGSSPSKQVDTVCPKPVSSNSCSPAKYGKDCKNIIKEEQSVKETTRNLGQEKFKAETSCPVTKKLKPVSSDFCWPAKHDNRGYQKIKKEASGQGDLHSSMNNVQFCSYRKPKEEQLHEGTTTVLGKRKVKVETSCVVIID
ncbi:hypothetical protein POM88_035596 [Heracleum sosnowskyi]|uniref:NAC domain-containing protein n=1 Tax=Heracleum sosnowskyi TaxID=360622 RepID=A0AAD8HLW3_9APIA|nr:hypothetical protein POM88_035593 [Heracleum sosnowskyi]KAK1369504.1 hypothetical protein POM88_035596 [Heracleum sosnowskyi]